MAAPWLKYQQAAPASDGPWTKYAQPAPPPALNGASDSGLANFAAGVGKSLVDTGHGIVQAGTDAARYFAQANPVLFGEQSVSDNLGGKQAPVRAGSVAGRLQSQVDQQQADETQRGKVDASLMSTGAGKAGEVLGSVAQAVAIPESRIAGASRLARIGKAAATGAGYGLVQPLAQGDSRSTNTALGAALGTGGEGAAMGLRKVATRAADAIPDEARQLWETAKAYGIKLTPAQISDSTFVKTLSSALNKLPFSGGAGVMKRQQAGFNKAVGSTFGAEGATKLTDKVMSDAADAQSNAYNALFDRNTVKLDDQAMNRLGQIEQEASNLTPDHAAIVKKQITDLLALSNDGAIPGRAYQTFRVDRLKKLEAGAKTSEPFKANLLRDIRHTIEDAANRSFEGNDAAVLKLTNQQFANRKVAEKALRQVEGANNNVRPASLWNLVNQTHGSTSDMRELARLGQGLKDPIADSGTALRQLIYHTAALGGGSYAATSDNPYLEGVGALLAGGAVGGRVANSNKLARILMREGRGQTAQRLAVIARGTPALMAQVRDRNSGN